MNLDCLKQRKAELEQSAGSLASSWQTIQGHKAEVDYWISEYERMELEKKPAEVEVEVE